MQSPSEEQCELIWAKRPKCDENQTHADCEKQNENLYCLPPDFGRNRPLSPSPMRVDLHIYLGAILVTCFAPRLQARSLSGFP